MKRLLVLAFLIFGVSIPIVSANESLEHKPSIFEESCLGNKLIKLTIDTSSQYLLTSTCSDASFKQEYLSNKFVKIANPGQLIRDGHEITALSYQIERTLEFKNILYITEKTYTKDIEHRKEVVVQKGSNGSKGIVTEIVRFSDNSTSTIIIDEWFEVEPVTKKINIGTVYNLQKVTIKGDTVYYWKTLEVLATSYDRNCYGCSDTTATGAKLKKGIIAVDPRVIPLHTKMYVPDYGFGQAEDVGGLVKGNKIDLGFYDLSDGYWSRRWVTIYIID